MSFNSAPTPGNNEKKIVEIHTPNLATDTTKRNREFDILRKALKKNPPKADLKGEPLQKVDTPILPKPENIDSEDAIREELWAAIIEDQPNFQRELMQLEDEEKQRSFLELILKKKWLELLKESNKIDEATIQQNSDLVEFLRGKNDPTSKKMLSELLQSTKVLQCMTAINKAEIDTATSDSSYWRDAYGRPQSEQPHESEIDQKKLSTEALLGRIRKDIHKRKKYIEHLESLDQSEESTTANIKKNKAILKDLQNLLATEETLLHPQKPYDQTYIQEDTARNGEIPVKRGEWEDTKMPETTS